MLQTLQTQTPSRSTANADSEIFLQFFKLHFIFHLLFFETHTKKTLKVLKKTFPSSPGRGSLSLKLRL